MTAPKLIAGLLIATFAAAPAHAKSATEIRKEAIEKRQDAQRASIANGRQDGSLTWWEKARLVREQRRIESLERKSLADGRITKQEYLDIKAAQSSAGKHIADDKHNPYVRGWFWRTFVD